MEYITLNNGVEMPVLGLGTFMLNGEQCRESVLAALECGYRLIDTAEAYGNEAEVGAALAESGVARGELFVATKVNFRSYENAEAAVAASLEKLRTDYLDLVLLHWPFGNYYAAWRVLERLYAVGTIRAIGVSNFQPDRLVDLINFNSVVPAVDQIETHLCCQRRSEHRWLEKYGVCHMAYAPLGQGLNNAMFEAPELLSTAAAHGRTPRQTALRFLIQSGVAVIPRSRGPEHIRENLGALDFTLAEEELERLAGLDLAAPLIGDSESPEKVEMAMIW